MIGKDPRDAKGEKEERERESERREPQHMKRG